MEGVFVHDHLDQLIAHHEGENCPGNGDNDVIRQGFDHIEHAGVPALGRGAHRARDLSHLAVEAVEQAVQIAHDAADQQFLDPLDDFV